MNLAKLGEPVVVNIEGEDLPDNVVARFQVGERKRKLGRDVTEFKPIWHQAVVKRETSRRFSFVPDRAGIWEIIVQGRGNSVTTKVLAFSPEMVDSSVNGVAMAKERKSSPRRKKATKKKATPEKHPAKRPPHRPHRCLPTVIDDVVTALGISASWKDAAEYAGISERTIHNYLERARLALHDSGIDADDPPGDVELLSEAVPESERPFVRLLQRATRARARGNIGLLAIAHKSAKGGAVWERRLDPNDPTKTIEVQVGFIEPDARTALKLLAVRQPKDYADKRQIEVAGEGGGVLGVQLFLPELEGDPESGEGGNE